MPLNWCEACDGTGRVWFWLKPCHHCNETGFSSKPYKATRAEKIVNAVLAVIVLGSIAGAYSISLYVICS